MSRDIFNTESSVNYEPPQFTSQQSILSQESGRPREIPPAYTEYTEYGLHKHNCPATDNFFSPPV